MYALQIKMIKQFQLQFLFKFNCVSFGTKSAGLLLFHSFSLSAALSHFKSIKPLKTKFHQLVSLEDNYVAEILQIHMCCDFVNTV